MNEKVEEQLEKKSGSCHCDCSSEYKCCCGTKDMGTEKNLEKGDDLVQLI